MVESSNRNKNKDNNGSFDIMDTINVDRFRSKNSKSIGIHGRKVSYLTF